MTLPQEELVPKQEEGKQVDAVEEKVAPTRSEANDLYNACKIRLLDVNRWGAISGKASADFVLMDERGNPKKGNPQSGDHFRIEIPGPGNPAGDGYDWVKVELVEDHSDRDAEEEWIVITVKPSGNPNTAGEDIAHFMQGKASSSFVIRREGNRVIAEVHGRNEKPNTTGSIPDKIRNVVVGGAAVMGGSDMQWNKLVSGLIKG